MAPVFRNAQISLEQTIDETPQGNVYLVLLQNKLPAFLRQMTPINEHETWSSFFSKLQDFRNQEMEDQSVDPNFQGIPFDQEVNQPVANSKSAFPLNTNPPPTRAKRYAPHSQGQPHQRGRYSLRHLPGRPRQQNQNDASVPPHPAPPTPPNSQPLVPFITGGTGTGTAIPTFESLLALKQEHYPCNCYACGRHGHKRFDCPIAAYLDLNNLHLKQVGTHVSTAHKNTTPELRQ